MINSKFKPLTEILTTLVLGVLVGFLTLGFINSLTAIESLHVRLNQDFPFHLLLIPIVLMIIEITKRNTLYFPIKAAHLTDKTSSHYWSVFMSVFHFLGTLLSHLSGVSVGRESAVVLFSSGLARILRLSWIYWGPIAGSIGFSAVVGQYWVAPFFMTELFGKTNSVQKIYSFMGAMIAVLIVKSFNYHQLFAHFNTAVEIGFFKKLIFLFLFAGSAGFLMRVYKKLYSWLSEYFLTQKLWLKVCISLLLGFSLFLPELRKFQSLGLYQLTEQGFVSGSFSAVIGKLFFTLISTSLGFLGGEFIPLIYSGMHFGYSFFDYFGFNTLMGSALGTYALFAGATRFKWTSYILILTLMGLSWWFWAYFTISLVVGFSGPESIYRKKTTA